MRATVFGAQGFVGRHLVAQLEAEGWEVLALGRGDERWRGQGLGHVFYCIGLTADFRTRPFDTIDAHVSYLVEVLRGGRFDSLVYCSSTRVYAGAASAEEGARLSVDPADPSDLYNLSKLVGEAACLAVDRPEVRVARFSNVFGLGDRSENFLTAVLREALATGKVVLKSAPASAKDYVAIEDVAKGLTAIAVRGRERIYNLAAGRNTTHAEILAAVRDATGCGLETNEDNPPQTFGLIAVDRLRTLLPWSPISVTATIPLLARDLANAPTPLK